MASSHPRPDTRRQWARIVFLAAIVLLGPIPLTHAQTGLPAGNSELPINLEAASSDFDYKNNTLLFKRVRITQGGLEVTAQQANATGLEFNNSEWRLQGDVRITVPGGKLQSSEARVMFRNNAIASASIKGTPAQFEQQLKERNQVARGRAGSIDYDVKAATVRLTGDAWLTDGNNEIRGNTLVYDIGRERVQANPSEKDPGGVRITINPPKKTPAAASDKSPTPVKGAAPGNGSASDKSATPDTSTKPDQGGGP